MIINIGPKATLYQIISESIKSQDTEILIEIHENAKNILNSANLISIKKILARHSKSVVFKSSSKSIMDYLELINTDRIEFAIPDIDISDDFKPQKSNLIGNISPFAKIGAMFKKKPESLEYKPDEINSYNNTTETESVNFFVRYKKLFVGLFILIAVVGIFFASMLYIPSATVSIKIKTDTLIKLIEVKAAKDYTVDIENKKIPATEVTATETESLTAKTVGKKLVGEKAEGKITFVNKTTSDIKIKKSTEIKLISTDKEGLKYFVTSETTIPKAVETTTDGETTKTYGEKEVSIVAALEGPDYNINKEQKFEVKDYDTDEIVGENKSKFEGGSQEEVAVVSQADLDDLRKTLEITVKEKVSNSIKRKLINSQEILEQALKFDIVTASYSKKLDEESDDLTLTITMSGTTFAFSKEDLDKVVKESAKTVVPESFILDIDNIKYETAATYDDVSKVVSIQVKLKSSITPNIDKEKLKSELAGKTIGFAEDYLNNLKNLDEYEIELSPRLPGFLLRMPYRKENISIIVNK